MLRFFIRESRKTCQRRRKKATNPPGRYRQFLLSAGMLVSAEVNIGSRTVMEYLLSPVQKVTHEPGREM